MATALKLLIDQFGHKKADCSTGQQSLAVAGVIESGDFAINIVGRTASVCSEKLDLTTEEFDVLVFLVGHPQSMVTPHTVLSTTWSSNGRRQTEFLKVLLSLRQKLEAAGHGKHYLRTEPWVIYRFESASSSA